MPSNLQMGHKVSDISAWNWNMENPFVTAMVDNWEIVLVVGPAFDFMLSISFLNLCNYWVTSNISVIPLWYRHVYFKPVNLMLQGLNIKELQFIVNDISSTTNLLSEQYLKIIFAIIL
jgi:hypothetical protein